MTRPTQLGPSWPWGATVGFDPTTTTEDLPDPIDRALDVPAYYPAVGIGSGDVVQDAAHTRGTAPGQGPFSTVTTTFATDGGTGLPTAGNTLVAVCLTNKTGASVANATPAGWTKRSIAVVVPGSQFEVSLFTKVSDGTEASVTVVPGAATGWSWVTLYIAEVGGSFGGYVEDATSANITSKALPSITPTSGIAALILAIAGATNAYAMSSGPSGYGTAILDDANANTGSSGRLNIWKRVVNPTSGSYGGTVTYTGGTVTFEWVSQVWFSATLTDYQAGNMTDGDDATHDTNIGTDVARLALDAAYRIVRSRLRIASATAGSRTYSIYGATLADYSDEVLLDSVTFMATGSYTAQDVEFSWADDGTARQFYRLEGTSETRRIHSFELYTADLSDYATALDLDAHVDDTADAHDASAISFTPAAGIAATDVQGAIIEDAADLAALIAVGSAPSSPIAMRYTFSTTTTDSDPGAGLLRVSNATQYLAVTIRADLTDSDGVDVTALLDVIATAGTGYVRLQKRDDPTKWLVATVSASASPSGYRNITIANIAKSANSPFANGDAILMSFIPTGGGGGGGSMTIEEVDGSPTDSAVTKLVLPNGSLAIASHVATYTPPAASGALVLLEQHTASASATLDFTTFISSTYDEYMIDVVNIIPATNAANLLVEVGTGGGPTYDTTAGNYSSQQVCYTNTGAASIAVPNPGLPVIAAAVSSTVDFGGVSASLRFTGAQSTTQRKNAHGTLTFVNSSPNVLTGFVGFQWMTLATAATALRFIMSSGNIASGTIRIYGVAK